MTSSAIELYDKLRTAPDDETRARIIAEAFEALEERYPHLGDMATCANLRETELRLVKEIEQVRADLRVEIEQVRANFKVEIEQVHADLKVEIEQVRANLKVEIEQVRTEVEKVRAEIKETELRLVKEIEQVRADLKVEIEQTRTELKVEITRSHTAWLKWSFLFWLSQFTALMLLLWRLWPLAS